MSALYPEAWRNSVTGAILTAIFGMVLLLVEVWALARVLLPAESTCGDDLLDDLCEIVRIRRAGTVTRAAGDSRMRTVSRWPNRRLHPWRFVVLIALGAGLALASAEAIGEGLPGVSSRPALVVAIFVSLEAAGVLLGYALFARFLHLLRD